MTRLISRILASEIFDRDPPVLLDIGASGGLPRLWSVLAPYSIGIAFDADSRDFRADGSNRQGWKKLFLLNELVTTQPTESVQFHLTVSPHCSSTLPPDNEALRPWAFRRSFDLDRKVTLPAIDLPAALARAGVGRVDWFKCDSQGTDLRLFQSLPQGTQDLVLAVSCEPGIIDAYRGEDKLYALMAYMDQRPFWVNAMDIKGSQWVGDVGRLPLMARRSPGSFFKTSPGWCEISYLNKCSAPDITERDLLLGIVFAMVHEQLGFASDLAHRGLAMFHNPLFSQSLTAVERRTWPGYVRFAFKAAMAATGKLVWRVSR